jgi:hypothetical protein
MVSFHQHSLPLAQGCLLIVKSYRISQIGFLALSLCLACAQAQLGESSAGGGSQGGDGGAGGGGVRIDLDASVPPPPNTPKRDGSADHISFGVDDAGNDICLSILSYGQVGTCGGQNCPSDAFQNFMNDYSKNANNGTTSFMAMVTTRTTLTDDFLNHYNVIVLQALEDSPYTGLWTFTQAEVDALQRWVTVKGGALITMTGYGSNSTEVTPLNQLLAFSDISYNTPDIYNSCLDNKCYCRSDSVPFSGWSSTCADCATLTKGLSGKEVGVWWGRSINCTGADCQFFAKDAAGINVGVAKVVGNGRVVAWADEWVTYTSQWGLVAGKYDNNAECAAYLPKVAYGVPQFWYNIFSWSSPTMQWCFTITVPPTADPGQGIIY